MMCIENTPIEDYRKEYGLWVKREDMCCPSGPHFSKTRGVYAHIKNRPERVMGVLDTSHSQGGWAVAQACALLNKECMLFYPVRKAEQNAPFKPQQQAALELGATLLPLQAGRSSVLYHQAKSAMAARNEYMIPNALKLPEMITETRAEVLRSADTIVEMDTVLISASSGTIAAGVIAEARKIKPTLRFIVHQGYSRPQDAIFAYMQKMGGYMGRVDFVDEGYAYADEARPGPTPPFPCNRYYDLKAFRWWMNQNQGDYGETLFWNVG